MPTRTPPAIRRQREARAQLRARLLACLAETTELVRQAPDQVALLLLPPPAPAGAPSPQPQEIIP